MQERIRRYLRYSWGGFEVLRPTGAARCADTGEIWHAGVDRRKLKILPNFEI